MTWREASGTRTAPYHHAAHVARAESEERDRGDGVARLGLGFVSLCSGVSRPVAERRRRAWNENHPRSAAIHLPKSGSESSRS